MKNKTFYGMVLGFLALFGVASVVPAMAQGGGGTDWANPGWLGEQGLISEGQTNQGSKLLDTVKTFINWMLGMLATIALVICLYAGFLMVTAAGDDAKYKKGMGILKQAGIGLVIIGLAWMIVSVVFWLITTMSS